MKIKTNFNTNIKTSIEYICSRQINDVYRVLSKKNYNNILIK